MRIQIKSIAPRPKKWPSLQIYELNQRCSKMHVVNSPYLHFHRHRLASPESSDHVDCGPLSITYRCETKKPPKSPCPGKKTDIIRYGALVCTQNNAAIFSTFCEKDFNSKKKKKKMTKRNKKCDDCHLKNKVVVGGKESFSNKRQLSWVGSKFVYITRLL